MARQQKSKNDITKYVIIGVVVLVLLFLVMNVDPTGKYKDAKGQEDFNEGEFRSGEGEFRLGEGKFGPQGEEREEEFRKEGMPGEEREEEFRKEGMPGEEQIEEPEEPEEPESVSA